jgi:hypothetical protein
MSDRFEFRVFAPVRRYRSLAQRFEGVLEAGAHERAQAVYLFAPTPALPQGSLKLQDGRMSIKHLVRRSDALELWRPEPGEFPLDRTRGVQIARSCPLPPVPGGGWAVAAHLLRDAEKAPDICLAHVRKLRHTFSRDGLLGEAVRLQVNGAEMASLAVEGEDPEAVLALVLELALADWENVSYPRMLQYLSGVLPLPAEGGARVEV